MAFSDYSRADSPPPRAPSPDICYTALPLPPSPHPRAQRSERRPRTSNMFPPPPGLVQPRTLKTSSSSPHLSADAFTSRTPYTLRVEPQSLRPVRSNLEQGVSVGPTHSQKPYQPAWSPATRTSSISSSPRSHRRRSSVATHPSCESSQSHIPPVPLIPDSARSSPMLKASPASQLTPIFISELHDIPQASERTASEKKAAKRPSMISLSGLCNLNRTGGASPSPSEKARSGIGLTCLKFFTLSKTGSRNLLRTKTTSTT